MARPQRVVDLKQQEALRRALSAAAAPSAVGEVMADLVRIQAVSPGAEAQIDVDDVRLLGAAALRSFRAALRGRGLLKVRIKFVSRSGDEDRCELAQALFDVAKEQAHARAQRV